MSDKFVIDCSTGQATEAPFEPDEETAYQNMLQEAQQAAAQPKPPSIDDRLSSVESAITALMGV